MRGSLKKAGGVLPPASMFLTTLLSRLLRAAKLAAKLVHFFHDLFQFLFRAVAARVPAFAETSFRGLLGRRFSFRRFGVDNLHANGLLGLRLDFVDLFFDHFIVD